MRRRDMLARLAALVGAALVPWMKAEAQAVAPQGYLRVGSRLPWCEPHAGRPGQSLVVQSIAYGEPMRFTAVVEEDVRAPTIHPSLHPAVWVQVPGASVHPTREAFVADMEARLHDVRRQFLALYDGQRLP